jgi:hypothetical protein
LLRLPLPFLLRLNSGILRERGTRNFDTTKPLAKALIGETRRKRRGKRLRPYSFVSDWWVGTIPSRIVSIIYINFD